MKCIVVVLFFHIKTCLLLLNTCIVLLHFILVNDENGKRKWKGFTKTLFFWSKYIRRWYVTRIVFWYWIWMIAELLFCIFPHYSRHVYSLMHSWLPKIHGKVVIKMKRKKERMKRVEIERELFLQTSIFPFLQIRAQREIYTWRLSGIQGQGRRCWLFERH